MGVAVRTCDATLNYGAILDSCESDHLSQRDRAFTALVQRAIRRGKTRRSGKGGTALPELAAKADAARDLAVHRTARLVKSLRAAC